MKTNNQEIDAFENAGALQKLIARRREVPHPEVRQRILRALIQRTCHDVMSCAGSSIDQDTFHDFRSL
jgi:hypothetical protein